MAYDLEQPARLLLHGNSVTAPQDWSGAEAFSTFKEALEAAVDRMQAAPWILTGGQTLSPAEIDDLWKELFRSRSD